MSGDSRGMARRILAWVARKIRLFFAAVGILFTLYHLGFQYSCVTSNSMAPTLQGTSFENGDWVLTERLSYWMREPRRWEVLTIRRNDGLQVMKRVIALPGERLQVLRGGRIIIDGREVKPPSAIQDIQYLAAGNLFGGQSYDCCDGYYVLGDDTMDSDDSRFHGSISEAEIVGRAWLILAPGDRRGFVNP
jgi:signal peptidase I